MLASKQKQKISQSDSISYKVKGFSANKYFKLQKEKILERIEKFKSGKLYLEIGGKFLHDSHASRVLPGFEADAKKKIFASLREISDVFFCVNYRDILANRQLSNVKESYNDASLRIATNILNETKIFPKIIINLCEEKIHPKVEEFSKQAEALGYETFYRYRISSYPHNLKKVLSLKGYGKDDHIPSHKKLILVCGAASNSGKMSSCLGNIYLDSLRGIESGYAKFETFPIWNLPLAHPINLAYEAATADIDDCNLLDFYHKKAYGVDSVNYNRDIAAFQIVSKVAKEFLPKSNFMRKYQSPTDMGINFAGFGITNDEVVSLASLREIGRRKAWYREIYRRGEGKKIWVKRCEVLEKKALAYIQAKGYELEKVLR
jgi:uncharacterized protein (UPF0371 family)